MAVKKKKKTPRGPTLKQKWDTHFDLLERVFDQKRSELFQLFDQMQFKVLNDEYKEQKELRRHYETQFLNLKNLLTELLSEEQLDAAKTSNQPPELYCIEWMKICIQRERDKRLQIPMPTNGASLNV